MIVNRPFQPENVIPTAISLQERLESIRQGEIDRIRGRLGRLSPEQEIAIESLTHGIINRVLHPTITVLETGSAKNDFAYFVEIVRRMFNLGVDGDLIRRRVGQK